MTITFSIEQLADVAQQILDQKPNKVILFNGDMGVGKTTLIKQLCKTLGVNDATSSPTFSLVNEYQTDNNQRNQMYNKGWFFLYEKWIWWNFRVAFVTLIKISFFLKKRYWLCILKNISLHTEKSIWKTWFLKMNFTNLNSYLINT